MQRREFLRRTGIAGGLLAAGANSLGASCGWQSGEPTAPSQTRGLRLYRSPVLPAQNLALTARRASAEIAPGVRSPILTWGEGPVGPTIEARTGDRARIVVHNQLDQPTIAHWHGLRPPQEADGHPRFAVGPGASYSYDFTVDERAALYWYHPHAHMTTGPQTYHGMAGLFVVRDDEEDALRLPSGDREISLVLQDKRRDAAGRLVYAAVGHAMMEGHLGDEGFANGVLVPTAEIESGLYRIRVLNAANARIFSLGLSNGARLVLIGTDGGLLESPVELSRVDIGTGERVDLLVDFTGVQAGATVTLRSFAFQSPSRGMGMGGMGMGGGMMGGGGLPQGSALDLLDFVVVREVRDDLRIPANLSTLPRLSTASSDRQRVFRFDSMMMSHTINGRSFEMERIDERVPFGSTEVWSFVNEGPFPHPVHMHAVHFQVLSRSGGRARLFPWEQGWKDTVLVFPGERVDVIARFDRHRGLFLMHCHNLEHEDMGMMMNFLID
jgi:FtsP/CotA-like multicopper oxidase with cupredoxin domain